MKKILAIFLSLILVISVVPVSLVAFGSEQTIPEPTISAKFVLSSDKNFLETDVQSQIIKEDIAVYLNNQWLSGSQVNWSTNNKQNVVINTNEINFKNAGTYTLTAQYSGKSLEITVYIIKMSDFVVNFGVLDEYVGSSAKVRIPECFGLTEIGHAAFMNNENITEVIIPEGVEAIGSYAFANCSNLEAVKLPSTLKSFMQGNNFSMCVKLKKVEIPGGVKIIPAGAFYACNLEEGVVFSYGIEEIHYQAFYGSNMPTIELPETVKIVCGSSLTGREYGGETTIIIANPNCLVGVRPADMYSNAYWDGMKHNWADSKETIANFNGSGSPQFTYIVPEGSSVATQLTTELIVSPNATGSHSVTTQNTAYFDDLRTQQKQNGVFPQNNEEFTIENGVLKAYKGNGKVIIPDTVTQIADGAFAGNSGITEVEIPSSVTKIGVGAFANCDKITTVTIKGTAAIGEKAFAGCQSLVTAKLGSPSSIGSRAFAQCNSLITFTSSGNYVVSDGVLFNSSQTELVRYPAGNEDIQTYLIPSSVTALADGAFEDSRIIKYLEQIFDYDSDPALRTVGKYAFAGCERISDTTYTASKNWYSKQNKTFLSTITSVGEGAFLGCVYIPELSDNIGTILSKMSAIGDNTFAYTDISNVSIPSGITSVGKGAFANTSLTSVTLGNITAVPSMAFAGCTNLATVNGNIASAGSGAFAGCTVLSSVTTSGITNFDNRAFENCSKLNSLSLTAATQIGNNAFAGCNGLTEITTSAAQIGKGAFKDCANLTKVVLSGAQQIYADAFGNSGKLDDITLPDNALNIADGAFVGTAYYNNNSNWQDGILYIGKHLIKGSATGTLTVKDGTVSIADSAFKNNTEITELVLPEGLEKIGNLAFSGCSALTNVTAPISITEIKENAFNGCTGFNQDSKINVIKNSTQIGEVLFNNNSLFEKIRYFGTFDGWQQQKTEITEPLAVQLLQDVPITCIADEIGFDYASITVTNSIAINFKTSKEDLDILGHTEPYAVFKMNDKEFKVEYDPENVSQIDGKDYYVFDFKNIAPHRLGDTVEATLFYKNSGEVYEGQTIQYSVKQYCYDQINNAFGIRSRLLRIALVDLLYYGAASQDYMDYKEDDLVTNDLTAAQKALRTTKTPNLTSCMAMGDLDNPTVNWTSVGLNLRDSVNIRFKIATTEDINDLKLVVTGENGGVWELTYQNNPDAFIKSGNEYYIMFGGLNAMQMREEIDATFYVGDKQVSKTLHYSIETYAARNIGQSAVADILKATMIYGDSVYNYVFGDIDNDTTDDDNWCDDDDDVFVDVDNDTTDDDNWD
ncbi:MAG: leucine-rich repeat domain-containing protein [Clostridia bacterium]|nr:leucine-rich repeat domain-containing protein [Clostridia bacterium]